MIDNLASKELRDLVEDIESRLGAAVHNLRAFKAWQEVSLRQEEELSGVQIDLEEAFTQWLSLRAKLQAAGVVSNVGG
jgi:hypothetical protein